MSRGRHAGRRCPRRSWWSRWRAPCRPPSPRWRAPRSSWHATARRPLAHSPRPTAASPPSPRSSRGLGLRRRCLPGRTASPATADDGARSAPADCTARVALAPGPALPPRALVDVEATAAGRRRRVRGRRRCAIPSPGVPALLWLAETLMRCGPSAARSLLDGTDPGRPDVPASRRWPLRAIRRRSTAGSRRRGAASTVVLAPPHRSARPRRRWWRWRRACATPARHRAARSSRRGFRRSPCTLVTGDLTIGTSARGRGLLLVDGLLDITADRSSLMASLSPSRGIRVASGARLDVAGAIWLGIGATLDVDGRRPRRGTCRCRRGGGRPAPLAPPGASWRAARSAMTASTHGEGAHEPARAGRRRRRRWPARRPCRPRGAWPRRRCRGRPRPPRLARRAATRT